MLARSGRKMYRLFKRTLCWFLATFIQHIIGSPRQSRKRKKGIHVGKEEVKLSEFADAWYFDDSTRKLLELVNYM